MKLKGLFAFRWRWKNIFQTADNPFLLIIVNFFIINDLGSRDFQKGDLVKYNWTCGNNNADYTNGESSALFWAEKISEKEVEKFYSNILARHDL